METWDQKHFVLFMANDSALFGEAAQGNMQPEHTQHARCALKKAPATDQVQRYQPTRHFIIYYTFRIFDWGGKTAVHQKLFTSSKQASKQKPQQS